MTETKPAEHAPAHKQAVKKAKARKPARKAVTKARRKVESSTGTVHDFQPRHRGNARPRSGQGANPTMETIMTQKKQQFDRMTEDFSANHKDHMDAIVKSGTIAMKGMEDMFKTWMQLTQTMTEKNAQAFKSLVGSKTLTEFTEAHNRLAQQNMDDLMSNATRLSELGVKITTETFEPITDQMNRSLKTANDSTKAA